MAQHNTEYKLDFTTLMLRNDLPNYRQVLSAYTQTIPGAPMNVCFYPKRAGIFVVKTNSDKDAQKLENSTLIYSYGKKNEKQVKIRFEKMPKFKLYCDPKWITMDWIQDSGLRFAENKVFDDFMSKFGTIIEPTHDDTNELGMKNGKKKLRIDLDKKLNIGRIQWIEAQVTSDEGEIKNTKGKIRVYYPGQPVFCRDCQTDHVGKCPVKIKREEALKKYEESRVKNTKTLIIGDSNLRHVNEQALHALTHIASGSKIGHVANVIQQSDLENKIEQVVVCSGVNNIELNSDLEFEAWFNKQRKQLTHFQNQVNCITSKGIKTKIVEVLDAPAIKENEKASKMRSAINKTYETMAKTINDKYPHSVEIISVPDELQNDTPSYEDEIHISAEKTEQILQVLQDSMPGMEFIVKTRPETEKLAVKKIYSGVYSSYPLGCKFCTKLGHNEKNCNAKNKGVKRIASDSDTPENKKTNTGN